MGGGVTRATSEVAPIPGLEENNYFNFSLNTAEQMGIATGLNAVFGAFSAYQSGKMKQLAYEHEAAMSEINARMIENQAQFSIAEKESQLADTLAMQNVMSAAQGRKGGSVRDIAMTSRANLGRDAAKIKRKERAERVSTLMQTGTLRAAGKAQAATSLIGAATDLSSGLLNAAEYF